jgi:hypothetical protein
MHSLISALPVCSHDYAAHCCIVKVGMPGDFSKRIPVLQVRYLQDCIALLLRHFSVRAQKFGPDAKR